ncbi:C-type mannose receptor 2-like [Mytilus trossulus]|uniref:C-type mannose receptor 2-like n=1 Tax=Mytilus trossulus TaxID=6551 RepID=UPI0030043015
MCKKGLMIDVKGDMVNSSHKYFMETRDHRLLKTWLRRCPKRSGYVYSETIQSCYKIHGKDTALQSAEYDSKCGLEGAELMRIDSEEKQLFIVTFLDYLDVTSWIMFQGSHLIAEEHWRYSDGSIITYFNWHSTQPDSSGNPGQTEVIGMKKFDGYKWHDLWLNYKGAFLCEKRIFD